MGVRDPLLLTVPLTPRQQRQLIAVSDELDIPIYEVAEIAIRAFLATSGYAPRASRRTRRSRARRADPSLRQRGRGQAKTRRA